MRIRRLAALITTAAACGPALAQGYLGAGLGQVRVDIDCTGTLSCDKTDTAYKVYGGTMFSPNLGVEAAYYDHGKLRQTATNAELGIVRAEWKGDGVALFAVGVLPMDQWSLFGKLGAASARVRVSGTSTNLGGASASERHTAVAWGLGAGYSFTPHLGARLEYERMRVEFMDERRHANLVTLGLHYRF